MSQREWSPDGMEPASGGDTSDMDGQTREGEAFGLKPNQPVRHRWASRRPNERERMSQLISPWGRWLHRLVRRQTPR
jgi:hypothetical protein